MPFWVGSKAFHTVSSRLRRTERQMFMPHVWDTPSGKVGILNWLHGTRISVDQPPLWIWLWTSQTPFHASSDPWAFMMKSLSAPLGVVLKPTALMPSL